MIFSWQQHNLFWNIFAAQQYFFVFIKIMERWGRIELWWGGGKRRHKKDKVRRKGGGGAGTISFWTIFNTVSYCMLFCWEKHTADNITWRPLDVLISCQLLLITRKLKSLLFAVRGTAVYIHINKYRKIFLPSFK
jgi:hypothetical protein